MVQGDLDSERDDCKIINNIDSGSLGSGICRELSFSGWYDEDGKVNSNQQLGNVDGVEDPDFKLTFEKYELQSKPLEKERLFHIKFDQGVMHMNGTGTMDNDSIHLRGNGSEKYEPFDVEYETGRKSIGLDSSISESGDGSLEKSSRDPISVSEILRTLCFILLWYTFSLFLTLYNKSLLGDKLGRFPAPLLMNSVHFAMQAVISRFITWFWSRKFQTSVVMSWRDYFLRVVPTSLATATDVDLSNASLVSISVTFATMCKSGAPIFLLLFAFAFRLEAPSFKLLGIMIIISIGILLTVAKDTEFEIWGFILVMLAAVMSGFRWCMTQLLLQKEEYGLRNPLTLMSYVTPVMAVVTALLSLAVDPWDEFQNNNYFNNPWHISRSCLLMVFGGTLAFFMVLTEYILVSETSAVTVTIAGVVKEAVTILVAVLYFHDEFTWLKGFGLIIIIIGVSLFNWYKYWKLKKGEAGEDHVAGSKTDSGTKYVILEETMEKDDRF